MKFSIFVSIWITAQMQMHLESLAVYGMRMARKKIVIQPARARARAREVGFSHSLISSSFCSSFSCFSISFFLVSFPSYFNMRQSRSRSRRASGFNLFPFWDSMYFIRDSLGLTIDCLEWLSRQSNGNQINYEFI